jgi:hypothetical protein
MDAAGPPREPKEGPAARLVLGTWYSHDQLARAYIMGLTTTFGLSDDGEIVAARTPSQ